MALTINRWWTTRPGEIYWLEITDRPDIGHDLNAPQRRDDDEEYWGYRLLTEIASGDIVFHYRRSDQAIVGVSLVWGDPWNTDVLWAAHGAAARAKEVSPYVRPGWRRGLERHLALDRPVTLEDVRRQEPSLRSIRRQLSSQGALYFPFELSSRRALRPMQAYLTKMPRQVVELFPALSRAADEVLKVARATVRAAGRQAARSPGTEYRAANETTAISARDPFSIDPALVERAIHGHAVLQNLAARVLQGAGIEPRSPRPEDPPFDLLWETGNEVFVAEIKSITDQNEEKQLRLGLGQVLRYSFLLRGGGRAIQPVLLVERQPADPSWVDLCRSLGIGLLWPEIIDHLIEPTAWVAG